jgi:hypothetical protein
MKRGSYKSRPLALLLAGALLAPAVAWGASRFAHGLILPQGAQEVGENRYRVPDAYEDTLKFFDKTYRGIARKDIVDQPGIRAVHYESDNPRSGYEGFNVYENEKKEVRIFVIPRPASARPAAKKHKGK